MPEVEFLGGCEEVGRAAILVENRRSGVLLDYGILLNDHPHFPGYVSPNDYNLLVLTHAHLDHTGAAPSLYLTKSRPVLSTAVSFELFRFLIRDQIKLSRESLNFGLQEVKNVFKSAKKISYNQKVKVKDWRIHFYDSGHIPGSFYVSLDINGKKLIYTSDINTINTQLINGAYLPNIKPDCLIIESTYCDIDHPKRKELEKQFIDEVYEVLNQGGKVLVPAFSISRSQEILMVLEKYGVSSSYPVYLDGMARSISKVFENYSEFLANPNFYKQALRHVKFVVGDKMRRKALFKPSVIVSPAGMLQGGPVRNYLKHLIEDERNALFFVGYQIEGTPGRRLLDEKVIQVGEELIEPGIKIKKFDFSSHAGKSQLMEIIKHFLHKDLTVFTVHGEKKKIWFFAQEISESLDINAVAPKNGDVYTL